MEQHADSAAVGAGAAAAPPSEGKAREGYIADKMDLDLFGGDDSTTSSDDDSNDDGTYEQGDNDDDNAADINSTTAVPPPRPPSPHRPARTCRSPTHHCDPP